ncbi:MAG: D-alanine-D-alanine ligase [Bradyrhizobium sp.]|nr:D-alanine-D-alanine ligase [Bradyrhizobium sp.]
MPGHPRLGGAWARKTWMAGTAPGHDGAWLVMRGPVPGIHVLTRVKQERRGWPGRRPAMTMLELRRWFVMSGRVPGRYIQLVMPGPVPGIHVLTRVKQQRRGWPGRRPAMTGNKANPSPPASNHSLSPPILPFVYQEVRRLTLAARVAPGCRGVSWCGFPLRRPHRGDPHLLFEVNTPPASPGRQLRRGPRKAFAGVNI